MVKDCLIKESTKYINVFLEVFLNILTSYEVECPEESIDNTRYEQMNLKNRLIIDITSDQFENYDKPLYVGKIDSFHRKYDYSHTHDYET